MKKYFIQSLSIAGIISAISLSLISVYSSGFALIDPKFHRALCCGLALIVVVLIPYRKIENSINFSPSRVIVDFLLIIFGILTVIKFYNVQTIMENELYDISYFDGLIHPASRTFEGAAQNQRILHYCRAFPRRWLRRHRQCCILRKAPRSPN